MTESRHAPGGTTKTSIQAQESAVAEELLAAILTNGTLCKALSHIQRFDVYVVPNKVPQLDDFNVLGHLRTTLKNASWIVPVERERGDLTSEGARLVYVAAVVHDLGELVWSERRADINFALKGKSHDEAERLYFHENLERMFPTASRDALEFARRAFDEVVMPNSHLHQHSPAARIFNAIELAGYVDTGQTVFHVKPAEIEHEWLPFSVMHRQIAASEELVPLSRGLATFYAQRALLIEGILEHFLIRPGLSQLLREREAKAIKPFPEIEISELAARWREVLSQCSSSKSPPTRTTR